MKPPTLGQFLLSVNKMRPVRSRSYTEASTRIPRILDKKKNIHDHLSPTNSKLLNILLSDYLPADCLTPLSSSPNTSIQAAESLPQGHQLVYFPIQARPSDLHADGTDMDHWPGQPFARRLWAGGEVRFRQGWETELQLNASPANCVEVVEDVRLLGIRENGAADDKSRAFVDVWRRYSMAGHESSSPAIEERRTLVFMPDVSKETPATNAPPRIIKAPLKADYCFSLTPSRALLANFSALTYNAHSIHLDTALAQAEGHPNLLVHGPLSLILMFAALRGRLVSEDAATREATRWIGYRNLAPLYCGEKLTVCLKRKIDGKGGGEGERKWDIWIEGKEGGIAVKGTAITGPL